MQPPFMTTFTPNSIHIVYTPAQQNPPPGPGTTISYHTGFEVMHAPEPGTWMLAMMGFGAACLLRRKRLD